MSRRERRRHERRIRSIRLRFSGDGEEHRAVTTSVSGTGAFLKAAHVPAVGTAITLREVYNPAGAQLRILGQVVWTYAEPGLDRPDTGFGLRFIELYTREDPAAIEEFVRYLDPDVALPVPIAFEERPHGVCAVYRFDAATDVPDPSDEEEANPEPEFEELVVVDLARELDRLDREQARTHRAAPRATDAQETSPSPPPPPPPPTPPTTPSGPPSTHVSAHPQPPTAPAPAAPTPPQPRESTRRRTVTGIFTALFGRRRESPELGFDQPRDQGVTPAIAAAAETEPGAPALEPQHDAHLLRVEMRWAAARLEAGIWVLEPRRAVLRGAGPGPPVDADVTLIPREVAVGLAQLVLRGRVVSVTPSMGGALEYTLALAHEDDPAWASDFDDFLRLVNGP